MDWFSTAVGFVAGAFTAAAGTYLGDKYTDQRRAQSEKRTADAVWKDVFEKFPAIMREMQDDVKNPAFQNVREFFVKHSGTTVNAESAHFQYFTDEHPDVMQAVTHLEEVGYIEDITPGNCPMYRMRLKFIERLKSGS